MENVNRRAPDSSDDVNYTQRMPRRILALLDAEAATEQRSRTAQVIRILEERYGLVAQERAEQIREAV